MTASPLASEIAATLKVEPNDHLRAGCLASPPFHFGRSAIERVGRPPQPRYWIAAIHTRFTAVTFFVFDIDRWDPNGEASVIRQAPTIEEAVAGLA